VTSYDFNLLCFAAISLSSLVKGSGHLCNLKHGVMLQCLFGFWLLVYSWLQPFSCIWYSTKLYRHLLFICVFCGWWFPLPFCAALSLCMCKYSPPGCLLASVILFLSSLICALFSSWYSECFLCSLSLLYLGMLPLFMPPHFLAAATLPIPSFLCLPMEDCSLALPKTLSLGGVTWLLGSISFKCRCLSS